MPDDRVIAVDVGGTDIKAAVVAGGGEVLASRVGPAPPKGPDAHVLVVDRAQEAIEELRASWDPVAAVGLVVPGIVDEGRGLAVLSENLGWRDAPLPAMVSERCGLPVAFGHDVRAGGLAESRLGAARGVRDVLFLPIGTGIAAALIFEGRVHAADGYAGEIGHADVGHGEPCACGQRGCLEAIASAAAIARRYSARSGRLVSKAEDVLRAAHQGDAVARQIWDEAVDALVAALAWAASVLAPEAVVIGGGLSRAGDALFVPLADRLEARLTFQRMPRLVRAALGDQAGCLGAGLLALDLVDGQRKLHEAGAG